MEEWDDDEERDLDSNEDNDIDNEEIASEELSQRLVIRDSPIWNVSAEYRLRNKEIFLYNVVKDNLVSSDSFTQLVHNKIVSKLCHPRIVCSEDIIDAISRGPASEPACESDGLWNQAVYEIIEACNTGGPAGTIDVPVDTFVPIRPGTHLFHFGNEVWAVVRESGNPSFNGGIVLTIGGKCTERASRDIYREYLHPFAILLELYIKRGVRHGMKKVRESLFNPRSGREASEDVCNASMMYSINKCLNVSGVLFEVDARTLLNRARVLTSLRLLSEAKRHREAYVSSVLAFAAIESVLGKEKEGISEQLARRAAVLLCPNANDRQRATQVIKKLYGVRSRIVHGESIDVADQEVTKIVQISELVLLALLEWDIAARRLGDVPNASGNVFFQRLQDADYLGKMLVAVPHDITELATSIFAEK